MTARCSLLTEPWCARASSSLAPRVDPLCAGLATAAGVPRAAIAPTIASSSAVSVSSATSRWSRSSYSSFSRAVRRSASRREFANTIEDRCWRTRSVIADSTCGQIDPVRGGSGSSGSKTAPAAEPSRGPASSLGHPLPRSGSDMSSTGTTTERSKVFCAFGATTVTGERPPRKRATSSTGFTVADSPMRCAGRSSSASRRSSESARCEPRFVAATACTSSTMTVPTFRSVSRACEVSMRNSDSGVVMRISGGSVDSARRSACGVSPERTPTRIDGGFVPSRFAVWVTPTSGLRRLRSTSTASAFSGET